MRICVTRRASPDTEVIGPALVTGTRPALTPKFDTGQNGGGKKQILFLVGFLAMSYWLLVAGFQRLRGGGCPANGRSPFSSVPTRTNHGDIPPRGKQRPFDRGDYNVWTLRCCGKIERICDRRREGQLGVLLFIV